MKSLTILRTSRVLRIARGGRLLPWLGPALRGLGGGRLKACVCVHPVAEQLDRWRYCQGCPAMRGCPYGELFEPDPPADAHVASGWQNAARPLVVAAAFPQPTAAEPGHVIPVAVQFVGERAIEHAEAFWQALRLGGDLGLGLGEDHVLFDVEPGSFVDGEEEMNLPEEPRAAEELLPSVRVELTSPLFLKSESERGRKRAIREPTFVELLRAGLRVLGPLCRFYGQSLPEEVFARVKATAQQVQTKAAGFELFRQPRWSNRARAGFEQSGTIGWAEYGPVPAWLLPWLSWSGRLHVGTHRVAGAGGWRVEALPSSLLD